MQHLEHMLQRDCSPTVWDGSCVALLFFSLKLVKQLWVQNSLRVSFPAGDRMMSCGRKINLTEREEYHWLEFSNSPFGPQRLIYWNCQYTVNSTLLSTPDALYYDDGVDMKRKNIVQNKIKLMSSSAHYSISSTCLDPVLLKHPLVAARP